jgi:hypothetical protein
VLSGRVVIKGQVFEPQLNLRSTVFAKNECAWDAGLKALKHHGPDRPKEPVALEDADLVITSYGTLRQDAELLRPWIGRSWSVTKRNISRIGGVKMRERWYFESCNSTFLRVLIRALVTNRFITIFAEIVYLLEVFV